MAYRTKTAAHVAMVLGLLAVACSQPDPAPGAPAAVAAPAHEDSAWIEGFVERRAGTRVVATSKNGSRAFFTASSGPDRRYRLGPLPPGEYDVSVVQFDNPEQVDDFPLASVTAISRTPVLADFTLAGSASLVVRFSESPAPGTLVTEIHLFAGSHEDISMARYRELRRAEPGSNRGRNTISADDLTTTFGGLAPGAYTACAVTNYGENDLRPTCDDAEVQEMAPTELILDVRLG